MSVSVKSRALLQAVSLLYNIFGTHCLFHPLVSSELTHILQKDIVQFHRGQTFSSAQQQFPALLLLYFQLEHTKQFQV